MLQRLSRILPTNSERATETSFTTLSTWPSRVSAGQTQEPLRFCTPTISPHTLEMSDCPPQTFHSAKAGTASTLLLPPFRVRANRENTPPLSWDLIQVPSRRIIATDHDSTSTSNGYQRNRQPLALFRSRPEPIFSPSVTESPLCLRTARAGLNAQADADADADTPTGTSVSTARDLAGTGRRVDADADSEADADARTLAGSQVSTDALAATTGNINSEEVSNKAIVREADRLDSVVQWVLAAEGVDEGVLASANVNERLHQYGGD